MQIDTVVSFFQITDPRCGVSHGVDNPIVHREADSYHNLKTFIGDMELTRLIQRGH